MKQIFMRGASIRRAACAHGLLIFALLAATGCSDTTSPGQQAALQVTSNTLTVVVGGTGRIFYTVTNTTNTAVNWSTANAGVATVDPTGIVSGIAPGTTTISVALVANPSVKQDVIVTVTLPPVEVVLDSVLDGVTGVRVFNDSVRATFMAHFTVNNQPANSRLETRVDNAPFALCQTFPSGSQINSTGAMLQRVVCPINTTQLDTAAARRGLPLFPNGAHTLNARIVPPAGNVLASATKTLQFVNRDFLIATTNATGGDSLAARGADLTITVNVVRFTSDSTALFATLAAASNDSPTPIVFNQTQPTRLPATFTVNATASAGAEGFFRLTPRITDQGGSNRTGILDLSRFLSGVAYDLAPPRLIAVEYPPGENTVEYTAVVLNHAAGIYAAGDTIQLARITGGSDSAAHPPSCTYRHLHGNILIQRQGSTLIEGPYTDPFTTTAADPCGWGPVVVVADSVLRFNINGFVQERGLTGVTVRLYMATGACDAGPIVDDVPVPQGTGVGQTPTPVVTFPGTTGGFNAQFQLRVDGSFFGRVACTVVQANDNRVTLSGQPAPNTTYLVYSSLIKGN
jgi:hypothetical protein